MAEFKKRDITPIHIPSPTKVYTQNIGSPRAPSLRWETPEWDLAECGRILDTESYVRRAFKNKKNLFLKEGSEFVGATPQRVQYIKNRFQQIEATTGIPWPMLLSQTIWSLIRTSNAFWVKVRDDERSGGGRRMVGKKELKPVAGYFPMAAETVRFKRDEFGTIKKYRQEIRGKVAKDFNPEDVIHFYFDKREGWAVGTPDLVPVKDDIRALRRIEENVELLVYQHLFPLYHYKVGTEDAPADVLSDGSSEIDVIRAKVQQMPSDGCWVTPERHEIKVIGAEGQALGVDKVIQHFKERIFTGLGVSSVDMGEGGTANRSTAQTMSRNLIDDTKANQKEFGAQFYSNVIQELLLESTFDKSDLFLEENKVYLKFKEIDFESRMAKENHVADIFLKNVITHSEMRQAIGYEPFAGEGWPTGTRKSQMFSRGEGDWAGTNYGLIERDKIILQSLDEPGTPTSQAEAKSRTTATKTASAGGGAVSNKNQPTNQHGTRASAKTNKDFKDTYEKPKVPSLDIIYMQTLPIESMFDSLKRDILIKIRDKGVSMKEITFIVDLAFTEARDRLNSLAKRSYRIGIQDTGVNSWDVQLQKADAKIEDHINKYVLKLKNNLISLIDQHTVKSPVVRYEDAVFAEAIFSSLEHRTRMIDNSEIMRAYNYGLSSGYRVQGFKELRSVRRSSTPCNICDNHFLNYKETDVIIYGELPPLHPHCTCTMAKVEG